MLITILAHRGYVLQFLSDYNMNSRMLIAVPVLLLGQQFMESRFRLILNHIYDARLLSDAGMAHMDEILASLVRWRDSAIPELLILLLLAIHTFTSYKTIASDTPWFAYGSGPDVHLTLAGWYAVIVTATIFQFLLGFSLWKWLLWTIFAFQLSRLKLRLVPSHPDENGGLGFLALSPQAFGPIAFAATIVIGAAFRHEILHRGAHLVDFRMPAALLVVIIFVVALGPLSFFVPSLAASRRKGILEYALVGTMQSSAFHEKWVLHRTEHEDEVLAAPEISTLCDYNSAFKNVEALKPFPIDKNTLIGLAISIALPALPTVVAEIPLTELLKQLFGALK
ncbi:MAG TPA: hypothetical protein VE779_10960 [Candidatus Angelobacter sp.]|nr:hypothetical protein [Candidatus Angelobacter sp.]